MRCLATGVWRLERLLDKSDCSRLIALAEQRGFRSARLWDNGRRNHEAFLDSTELITWLAGRLNALYASCGLPQVVRRMGSVLEFYRYADGGLINPHCDSAARLDGCLSDRTLLIYLNCGFDGGNTLFPDLGLACPPETGDALLFEHGIVHAAAAVYVGTKYVLRASLALQ